MKTQIVEFMRDGTRMLTMGSKAFIKGTIKAGDRVFRILSANMNNKDYRNMKGKTPEEMADILQDRIDKDIRTYHPN